MDADREPAERDERDERDERGRDREGRTAPRVLTWRVPLWLALAVVVVLVVAGAVAWFLRDVPELGPAVSRAETIEVEAILCNQVVDRHGINPRSAELDLERELEALGADDASVTVDRRDCRETAGGEDGESG